MDFDCLENPFTLELQVDDEISFRLPSQSLPPHENNVQPSLLPNNENDVISPILHRQMTQTNYRCSQRKDRRVLGSMDMNAVSQFDHNRQHTKTIVVSHDPVTQVKATKNLINPIKEAVFGNSPFEVSDSNDNEMSSVRCLMSDPVFRESPQHCDNSKISLQLLLNDSEEEENTTNSGNDVLSNHSQHSEVSIKSLPVIASGSTPENMQIPNASVDNATHAYVIRILREELAVAHDELSVLQDELKVTQQQLEEQRETTVITSTNSAIDILSQQQFSEQAEVVLELEKQLQIEKVECENIRQELQRQTVNSVELNDELKLLKDDNLLMNIQVRTLSQHILQLESTLESTTSSHTASLSSLQLQHAQQIANVTRQYEDQLTSLTESLSNQHDIRCRQLASDSEISMAELRNRLVVETETLRTALNDSQNTIAVRESQLLREAAAAVQEAKQAVYDKVKAQFDAGNKEFQRVKSQLRYSEEQVAALSTSLDIANRQLMEFQQECSNVTVQHGRLTTRMNQIAAHLGLTTTDSDLFTEDILEAVTRVTDDLREVTAQRDALKQASSVLEVALTGKESELRQQLDRAIVAEALLATCRLDLAAHTRDSEHTVKTLTTSNEKLQKSLAALATSVSSDNQRVCQEHSTRIELLERTCDELERGKVELEGRCARLRKMNEELVVMLENKVYGVESQNTPQNLDDNETY